MSVFSGVFVNLAQFFFCCNLIFLEVGFDQCRMSMQQSKIDTARFWRAEDCVSSAKLAHISYQFLAFFSISFLAVRADFFKPYFVNMSTYH